MNIDEILEKNIDDDRTNHSIKEAIKEIVTKALDMAAGNAVIEARDMAIQVDKDSIKQTINQIKF